MRYGKLVQFSVYPGSTALQPQICGTKTYWNVSVWCQELSGHICTYKLSLKSHIYIYIYKYVEKSNIHCCSNTYGTGTAIFNNSTQFKTTSNMIHCYGLH